MLWYRTGVTIWTALHHTTTFLEHPRQHVDAQDNVRTPQLDTASGEQELVLTVSSFSSVSLCRLVSPRRFVSSSRPHGNTCDLASFPHRLHYLHQPLTAEHGQCVTPPPSGSPLQQAQKRSCEACARRARAQARREREDVYLR